LKISTILDHIDNGYMALPEFQRGYVWNRDQVRGLMQSLYRRHPVGSLLVWVTQSEGAPARGDAPLAPGVVKLLLDGQQRITSLYGVVRGRPPRFFDGKTQTFSGLHFHLDSEEFSFYQPVRMRDDPFWIDVTRLMHEGVGEFVDLFMGDGLPKDTQKLYYNRLSTLHDIPQIDLHTEEVTGNEKTIDVVVDIFNRVNSGGTKLSKGDLALAKICADWPEARARMKDALARWESEGYSFDLDWFLRNVNTILTGEAKFLHLHDVTAEEMQRGVEVAEKRIDTLLNIVADRLGLDHDRVLFSRYAFPVMTHYLDRRGGHLADHVERDRLVFWYLQSAMWGRFSGSTETKIDKDLQALEDIDSGLDRLIRELCLEHGRLEVQPDHFGGWSLGARFYPVLYLLTRIGEARDWKDGFALKESLRGRQSRLEVHHIFPKAQLYKAGFERPQVNAVANYCFQTRETNNWISDRLPEDYFPEVEAAHPGALATQWVPMDPDLWRVERYLDFLEARKRLLAERTNELLRDLYHSDLPTPTSPEITEPGAAAGADVPGGIESAEEEETLRGLNRWVQAIGLPRGQMAYELVDSDTGEPLAVLDLAWPDGLQVGLSDAVAVLLNEGMALLQIASREGYRCFTDVESFQEYVETEVTALVAGEAG